MFVERYDNGINGNYLILENEQTKDAGYMPRMLVENHINAFLKTGIVRSDGREQYVYDITSKTCLYSLYEKTEMDYGFLCALISAIASGLEACEEYLLPCEHLMFDPKHIYVDQGNDRIQWCYYPGTYTTLAEGINDLAEYILERADHTDKAATALAYDLYKQAVSEDYTLRELLVRNVAEKTADEEDKKEDSYLIEDMNDLYLPDEDDMPVMPLSGKVIMSICSVMLLIIAGTIFTAAIYKSEALTAVLAMKEMRILTAITSAVCVLMPIMIFLRWYGKVRRFRKLMEEAGDGRDDIYMHLSDNEQAGATGRLGYGRTVGGTVKLNDTEEDKERNIYPEGPVHRLVRFANNGLSELRVDRLPYTIGKKRGVCDGIIESDAVSRIHARLIFEGGAYYMTDLNSTNGTFVNGCRLKANDRIRLGINDEIRFGRELFYFR